MREIKFRAWDKAFQKMFKCIEITYKGKRTLAWRKPFRGEHVSWCGKGWYVGEECYLMQYTGLKDVNGKEIYEKDIVHLSSEDGMNYNALIIFEDGAFCAIDGTEDDYGVRRYGLMRYELQMEVIGNIYENPELLEGDQ